MPRLDLERVEVPSDRPEMDRQAVERNRWLTLASAGLAGLGALTDSAGLAKAGEGLSSGFSKANRARRKAFYDQISQFKERQQAAREENRARQRAEETANFEAALENRRDRREAQQEKAAAEREQDRQMEQIEKEFQEEKEFIEWKRGRPLTEEEKKELWVDKYNAVTDRINALTRRRGTGDSGDEEESPEASYREQTNLAMQLSRKTDQLVSARQELDQMSATDAGVEAQRERVARLQEERDKLLDQFNETDVKLRTREGAQRTGGASGSQPSAGGRRTNDASPSAPRSRPESSAPGGGRGSGVRAQTGSSPRSSSEGRSPGERPEQDRSQQNRTSQREQLDVQTALGQARSIMSERSLQAAMQYLREEMRKGRLTNDRANRVLDSLGVQ
jgi:hypothetical protein